MKTLSPEQKRGLAAKIEQQRVINHQKEQEVLRLRAERRRSPIRLSNWIATPRPGKRGRLTARLRAKKREMALDHVFEGGRQLKMMPMLPGEKEALRRKIEDRRRKAEGGRENQMSDSPVVSLFCVGNIGSHNFPL